VEASIADESFIGKSMGIFEIAENAPLTAPMLASMKSHFPGTRLVAHGCLGLAGSAHVDIASLHLGMNADIADASLRFLADHKIPLWTLHIGSGRHASFERVVERIQLMNGLSSVTIAVEGCVPPRETSGRYDQTALLGHWSDYIMLLDAEIPFVINTAHMDLIAEHEGDDDALLFKLLQSPNCKLVHTSLTDGASMRYWMQSGRPAWTNMIRDGLDVISEADLMAGQYAPWQSMSEAAA